MPSFVSSLVNAITRLNRLVFVVTVWLMAPVVPIMIYEVIARYMFGAPTVWAMELVVLVFGPYFLLGGPYLLHTHSHVGLDVLRQRLSPVWNRIFDLINYPVIMAFCAILLWYSLPPVWSAVSYGETSFSAWNPPVWPAKLAVPLAVGLMMLQALAEFLRTLSTPAAADNPPAQPHLASSREQQAPGGQQ
jgi:TRAP-type mannitol/chloroaromatic compound transport system permease small subunit